MTGVPVKERRRRVIVPYVEKIKRIAPANLVALWPLDERSGAVAYDVSGHGLNGAHSNVTLGADGIGDGKTAASYNGTTSLTNIYSAGLNTAFNGQAMTLAVWLNFSGAVWADATFREMVNIQVDVNNFIYIAKPVAADTIQIAYKAGGTAKTGNIALTGNDDVWLPFALTASKSADEVKFYSSGAQAGATQNTLGTWAGSLSSTKCTIGAANTTPALVTSGLLAVCALFDTALGAGSIAEMAAL